MTCIYTHKIWCVFTHIPREENKEADRMANFAIDAKDRVEL